MTKGKIIVLLLAGTLGGMTAGIPVPQSMIQAGSLGFLVSLGYILGELECRRKQVTNKGTRIRAKWLALMGTIWGAAIGGLTSNGILTFDYGVHSVTFASHYPRNNTFGLLVEGVDPQVLPTIVTGIFVAVALGLAFNLLKAEDKMWFLIPWCVPLGWWTGAESLAVGQALGYLQWEFIGPAQIQGMRFGIPWMEAMIIARWALMRSTGELQALRARIKAEDDAKWAAAAAREESSRVSS